MDENNIQNEEITEDQSQPVTEAAETQAAEVTKQKSKKLILYICAFAAFIAVAVTALVCFGLYANDLVHGEDEESIVSYCVEYNDINV